MDSCQGVEREVSKVSEKFHSLGDVINENLEEAIQHVQAAKNEIQYGKHFSQIFQNFDFDDIFWFSGIIYSSKKNNKNFNKPLKLRLRCFLSMKAIQLKTSKTLQVGVSCLQPKF